jgi:endoglucanase
VHAGEYADASARDNLLWAAAELFRTTGEARYRDAYEKLLPDIRFDPTAGVTYKDTGLAALWAYAMTEDGDKAPGLHAKARDTLIAAADWYIRKARENPFRAPVHQHIGFVGWGSFGRSTRATLPLLQAHKLTGERSYLAWAWQTPSPQLGANPQAVSYITGIGARSPLHPLSKLSKFDGSVSPLRGIPVHGPHFHLPGLWAEMISVNGGYVPRGKPAAEQPKLAADFAEAYPVLRRYTDSDYLPPMSEPTVAEYAEAAVAYALLRNADLP